MSRATPIRIALAWLLILGLFPESIQAVSIRECSAYLKRVAESGPDVSTLSIPTAVYERPIGHNHFGAEMIPGYDPNAIYVGVQNNEGGAHHYYLVVKGVRYEITSKMTKARIKRFGQYGIPIFSKGVIFELKVRPEEADELIREMDSTFHFICLHAICRPLSRSGISFHDGRTPILARTFDSALLQGNFYRRDGTKIPMRMIYENKAELAHFVSLARKADGLIVDQILTSGGLVAALAGFAGYIFYSAYQQDKKDESARPGPGGKDP